jgi:hypothetical protein
MKLLVFGNNVANACVQYGSKCSCSNDMRLYQAIQSALVFQSLYIFYSL